MAAPPLRFRDFELDPAQFELRRAGHRVRLERKPLELLILLVEKWGELVSREEIIQRVWGKDFFFDAERGVNNAIRKIRSALNDDSEQPRFVETVVGKGYRFIAPMNGGSPTAQSSSRASTKEPTAVLRRLHALVDKRLLAGVGLLFAAAATVVTLNLDRVRQRFFASSSSSSARIQSLAVLPLVNLTGNPDQEYFADGMTEALTNELGKLGTLRVISRTSAMRYKQTKKSVPEIAHELNVDAVVEGAVQRSGERVAITAQLVYAPADQHLWAKSYEHDLRDVLSMQREVAEQIAHEVQAKIVPRDSRPAAHQVDPEAYKYYLLGRYAWESRSKENLLRALTYFQGAVDKDPNFALAYAGEAEAYIPLVGNGLMPLPENLGKANAAATKALALDDSLAEAHNALAAVFALQYRWQDAEREFKRAIELNPSYATAHLWYGHLHEALGQQSANLAERKLAHELDPLNFTASGAVGDAYRYLGEYDQAIAEYKRALELNPEFSVNRAGLGEAYIAKKMYAEAITEFTKAGALDKLGYANALSGNKAKAREILKKLNEESKSHYVSPQSQARVLVGLGRNEEAISWLEKAEREHAAMNHLKVDPEFAPLHTNPRFQQLLRRIGLAR